ncbi:GIY-YIG nuclease family protein [Actinosynnema sp. NPDC053489]|uniref:GIY-YIG nuclease family protein n=1 Tax=Actinosynnema sp. NPDC053489 TaxID=3363916 RepID=UPI0037C5BC7D
MTEQLPLAVPGTAPRPSAEFQLSITRAMRDQLAEGLNGLEAAKLNRDELARLSPRPGIYELYLNGGEPEHRVYVGKATNNLPERLGDHLKKLSGRRGLDIDEVRFKCLYVNEDLDAASPEKMLIKLYRADGTAPWNNSGFGGRDLGRNRDHTVVEAKHFDARYPIDVSQPIGGLTVGAQQVRALLSRAKKNLPYLFRYETKGHLRRDLDANVTVPSSTLPFIDVIRLALAALPEGWQATALPGYMILYKESVDYRSASAFWRRQGDLVLETKGEGFLSDGDVDTDEDEEQQ